MSLLAPHPATRYVVPLREGGSLPAVLETERGDFYVTKFRGAGQGARALIAELITGLLARHLGFRVPDVALIHLDPSFGRTERDPEIQDILQGSRGLNVGLAYLEGALPYDPVAAADLVTPGFAADLVWFDAYTTNVDRTPRNPNLLVWREGLWLIDHGASLYVHHNWDDLDEARIHGRFPLIKEHVLLPEAGAIEAADERMRPRLDRSVLEAVLAKVPDALLMDTVEGRPPPFDSAEANRAAYLRYLTERLEGPRAFVEEAEQARTRVQEDRPRSLGYRR